MKRLVAFALACAGCGRIGFADVAIDAASLAILPVPATILPSAAMRLEATEPVTWSIDDGPATIDADGTLRALASPGTVHVRATAATRATVAIEVVDTLAPSTITSVGTMTNASGLGQQTHVFRARELGQWWVLTQSSSDKLVALSSTDFQTWSTPAGIDVGPTGNDGRNLTLAERVIGGTHVVHVSVGTNANGTRGRSHLKATVDADGMHFELPQPINSGGATDPDGPALAITAAGLVVDGSGWDQTPPTPPLSPCGDGDVEVYQSAAPDTGTTDFSAMAFAKTVTWCVPSRVNSRFLYADGERLVMVYEDGTDEPDPQQLLFQLRDEAGTWSPDETVKTDPPAVFPSGNAFAMENWTVRAVGSTLHAIRRGDDGVLEHRTLAGTSWIDAPTPPQELGSHGSGLVASAYGTGLVIAQLDGGTNVEYTFCDAAACSAWRTLATDQRQRGFLAGSTPADGERPALIWTESGALVGATLP